MVTIIGKQWRAYFVCAIGVVVALLSLPTISRAAGDYVVYDDALATGWQNWSWGGVYAFSHSAETHAGTHAIAATYTQAWAGLYLAFPNNLNATDYASLRFWVHGGSAGGQTIIVHLADETGAWVGNTTIHLIANTWVEHDIPLATLGGPSQINAIIFQEGTGGTQPTFYVDAIDFVDANQPVVTPTPPTPGSGTHTLAVDLTDERHTISDGIYGMSFADLSTAAELRLGVNRWGGNAVTRYNYQADVSNRASDWYFLNVPNDVADEGALPVGSSADNFVAVNQAAGSATMLTMPLIGYTPSGRNWDCAFPRSQYPVQDSFSPYQPDCGNGKRGGNNLSGNPLNTSTAIDQTWVTGWIGHLVSRYGRASQGGVPLYSLDNEPMLWHITHRDVHPDPVDYDEIVGRSQTYGAAIKSADPTAATVGPAVWGWTAYFYSAYDAHNGDWATPDDANAHGGLPFVDYYLQEMAAYEAAYGTRILDYLDLHFYPQGTNVALATAGNQATQALRLRQTRGLWDPTYIDESWIGDFVQLIPRMKSWVDTRYPNTKLSISEYNFGGVEHVNGAVTLAEVLGIFGREGLDMAMLWDPPNSGQPAMYAFRMYRNYDGNGGRFGDVSLGATASDEHNVSMFAARRSADHKITLMVVNKTFDATSANIMLPDLNGRQAELYRYSTPYLSQIVRLDDVTVTNGLITVALPAQSFMLVVVDAPAPGATGSDTALRETTPKGSVRLSDFGSTWALDGIVETVHESADGALDHRWQFNVMPGGATLYVNAWVKNSAENESFTFEYATDGATFTPMVTINSTTRAPTQSYSLPPTVSGEITVRLVDGNPSGDSTTHSVAVDYLEFQSVSSPTAVTLGAQTADQPSAVLPIVLLLVLLTLHALGHVFGRISRAAVR